MENSIPVQINQFPQPPAEPSDNRVSLSFGNGYKATPVKYYNNKIVDDDDDMIYSVLYMFKLINNKEKTNTLLIVLYDMDSCPFG